MYQPKKTFILLQERDFGEVLNDSFGFIKTYGKSFYKALLYAVLPLSLLSGVFSGLFLNDMANNPFGNIFSGNHEAWDALSDLFSMSYFASIGLSVAENMLSLAITYTFLRLYHEQVENPDVGTIWDRAKGSLLHTFLGTLLSGVLIFGAIFLISLVVGVISSALGGGAGVFIAFILIILFVIGMTYASVALSMLVPAIVLEDKNPISALRRSIHLVSSNWGQTFLIVIVCGFMVYMVMSIFSLPIVLIQWFATLNSMEVITIENSWWMKGLTVVGSIMATIGSALTMPVLYICLGFQFFNLQERTEGIGLQSMIASFGTHSQGHDEDERY